MRPKKHRHIQIEPKIRLFKPQGILSKDMSTISLSDEELEALRLRNVEDLDQDEAAAKMGISQSTFQRLLTGLYKKIAIALIEGKAISISKADKENKIECWECSQKMASDKPGDIVCRPCNKNASD